MSKNNNKNFINTEVELLNYQEVSRLLKRSVNTLRKDVSNHRIPFIKLGKRGRGSVRFSRQDIEKWIESKKAHQI